MIYIKNKILERYLEYKLDKIENGFTEEELERIDEITINSQEINGNFVPVYIDEVKYFKNLKDLELINVNIKNSDFNLLKSLNKLVRLTFDRCVFEDATKIKELNLEVLNIICCDIDVSFVYDMKSLKGLSIIKNNVSLQKISEIKDLKYLQITNSNVVGNIVLPKLLQELYIDKTNIIDLTFINDYKNIKKISISYNQYEKNKELIKNFKDNGIVVMNENMIEF